MAENAIRKYKLIVVGGSAGSLDAILKIVAALPDNNYLATVIIVHRKNDNESILVDLLSARTILDVKEIEDKEIITGGTVYIAPADYHLLFENENMFSLDASEKIHYSRPSIDVSFESAARIFGEYCIGILLSGANADGAEGLMKIKQCGGFTIVQNPESAEVAYMPQQALDIMNPDAILNAGELSNFIYNLFKAN